MYIPRQNAVVPVGYDVEYLTSAPTQVVRTYSEPVYMQVLVNMFSVRKCSMHDYSYV
jgi:hypothetical protein